MTLDPEITETGPEPIAVIGMAGRFPGADNIQKFWENIRDGVESITFFTHDQLREAHIEAGLLEQPGFVGADGIIENIEAFDAAFFNYTPREAEIMDPQHRLFLECAWEVLEQAGYDSEQYPGRVGVFGGAGLSSYLLRNIMGNARAKAGISTFQTLLGNDKDFVATRVSYKLNLKGPSMAVATLCSSSLVAIDLACRSLWTYQCDMALAGGVSLQVSRGDTYFYQEGGIGDPTGHCRAFDADARGTVSGSGLGIVVLKRLSEALEDGDHIHAVIRGSAVNNDGADKISYIAPRLEGYMEAVIEAQEMAGIHPETITMLEAHGTGTEMGDPVEVAALTQAFRSRGATENQYCALGSVKPNIGHLVTAAGVTSFIKAVLALENQTLPASLNFERPNPRIDFAGSPFFVNTRTRPWPRPAQVPRRAGVSAFGIGGTNAHVILEEAPAGRPSDPARPWQLLILSARTESALEQQTENLRRYLEEHPAADLADVAFTLQVGRRALSCRRALACESRTAALEALRAGDPQRLFTRLQVAPDRPVVWNLTGRLEIPAGSVGELYRGHAAFHELLDQTVAECPPLVREGGRDWLTTGLATLREPFPAAALVALEYALSRLWLDWGLKPQKLQATGRGLFTAAVLAGTMSLSEALDLALAAPELFPGRLSRIALKEPQLEWLHPESGIPLTGAEIRRPEFWLQTLSGSGRVTGEPSGLPVLSPLEALTEAALCATWGRLWTAGVPLNWQEIHKGEYRRRLALPTYPFERRRYWIEPDRPQIETQPPASRIPEREPQPPALLWSKPPEMESDESNEVEADQQQIDALEQRRQELNRRNQLLRRRV